MTYNNDNDTYNAHSQIFANAYVLNLRFCVPDEQAVIETGNPRKCPVVVYELVNSTSKTLFTRRPQVRLTDMSTAYAQKVTATLTLVANTMNMSHYTGSVNDGMGHNIKYDVRVRTDMDEEMRARNIMAVAEVTRYERLDSMLSRWSYDTNDYDIYSSRWENDHRPAEPAYD